MKNLFAKAKEFLVIKEDKILVKPRQVFVNHDGTIAESHDTYKGFRQDVIKSSGFGW